MLIAGAGGHALEIKEELEKLHRTMEFQFFDDAGYQLNSPLRSYPLYQDLNLTKTKFALEPQFALGIGNPDYREKFTMSFEDIGGHYFPVHSCTAEVSVSAQGLFDAMAFSFVGPKTKFGKAVLVNSRANVHHEAQIGDFTEIGPGALILGQVKIGRKCRIGAGAVLLPGVQLGDQVIVGAGAVVTKNIGSDQVVVGVPAKPFAH
ncbi:acetyltransferase [Algoriphagus litoralis]|uniref:acetyltransferase n=1 Tax=Algoriphagus litoralis TaxID=2202829 RepID=UPI000DB94CFC|nr:acetyltransferase [Algoriphagus litoralis]